VLEDVVFPFDNVLVRFLFFLVLCFFGGTFFDEFFANSDVEFLEFFGFIF
jgi:hypothetical protein